MQGKNKLLLRHIEHSLSSDITRGQSVLLFGPRQVGKTTLIKQVIGKIGAVKEYYLQDPTVRIALEADPGALIRQVEALKLKGEEKPVVFIDEAQKIPDLFDAAQYLIDQGSAVFILSGSSARKLRKKDANLLPGRVEKLSLDPLLWSELGLAGDSCISALRMQNTNEHTRYTLEDMLVYGSLPALVEMNPEDRARYLQSYAEIYLEEEIRAEAVVRKVGAFSRFLELAANESGTSPNLTKLSNESGVSTPTIKEFYQILEDTLVAERVDAYLHNARKRILASPRYYLFDLGVRNALARLQLSPALISHAHKGILFEHMVVLELRRRIRALGKQYQTYYWRTSGGTEVDCVLDLGDELIPIEIKASKSITASDLTGLKAFLRDYQSQAKRAFLVTPDGEMEKLSDQITRIPWRAL